MICGECGRRLTGDDFYASNLATCKDCHKAAAAARRKADPEASRLAVRQSRVRSRLRAALLEQLLRIMAVGDPDGFFAAALKTEDDFYLDAGTVETLFRLRENDADLRSALDDARQLLPEFQNFVPLSKDESTTTRRDQDVA